MKNSICYISALCIVLVSGVTMAQSDPSPYSYSSFTTETIRSAGFTTDLNYNSIPADKKNAVVNYFDGLGRAIADVSVRGSHNQKDVVLIHAYNEAGLPDTTYLPYAATTQNGSFTGRVPAIMALKAFYQNTSNKTADDVNPFATTSYELSPLAYVKEQGAPGTDWQIGTNHTMRQTFRTNAANEFRIWRSTLTSPGYYAAGTLFVTEVTDENGNKTLTIADKRGMVLEKHVQADATTWLKTLYIYDDLARLAYVLQPEGVSQLGSGTTITTTLLDQYGFTFVYDQRGRLVEKKVPGAAPIYYAYDPIDRLTLVQDGNLRPTNQWLFVKYDKRQRVVMQGFYTDNTYTTRTAVQQNLLDGLLYTSGNNWYERKQSGGTHGYSNLCFPSVNTEVIQVNYYDDYDLDVNGTADYSYTSQGITGESTQAVTVGKLTATKALVLGSSSWVTSYFFYDKKGQLIQMRSNNHLSSTIDNLVTNVYNFDGTLERSKQYHKAVTGHEVTSINRYEYDHAGRIRRIYNQLNTQAEVLNAEYEYNDLGQLVDKKLHSVDNGATFLQSVDYRYSIRGWTTHINNATLEVNTTNDDSNDLFGMELMYQATESGLGNTAYYNGNVSALKWKGPGSASGQSGQRSYQYAYDKSNRLTTAAYKARGATAWDQEVNAQNEALVYDKSGNIISLQRNQRQHTLTNGLPSYTSETIDNLTYTYASGDGNRLSKVEDTSGKNTGFNNAASASSEITYDISGNVTKDLNKGISNVVYNKLGKTAQVTFSDGRVINYTYDGAGNKLTMSVTQGGNTTTTHYVNGYVYNGTTLEFAGTPEGRVVKNGSVFEYQYALSDHQGNTRVVFTSATPAVQAATADFESSSNSNFLNYPSGGGRNSWSAMNHTPSGTYSQLLNGGNNSQVGIAKSYKVYPGDKVKIQAYAKYVDNGAPGNLGGFATALLSAYGLSAPAPGETATPAAALNSWGSVVASGSGNGTSGAPKAFVNILVVDKQYNFLDAAFDQINDGATSTHDLLEQEVTITEEGYVYVYLSNENASQVNVYFDDVVMTYTPSPIIQYNEYYPFGLQASTSWTRDNNSNQYLYNSANELNTNTGWYEMFFRGYDPTVGRMLQVDPMATSYTTLTPYNYAANDPVYWNDPTGAYLGEEADNQAWYLMTYWHRLGFEGTYTEYLMATAGEYGGSTGIYTPAGDVLDELYDNYLRNYVTRTGGFGQTGSSWADSYWYVKRAGSWRSSTISVEQAIAQGVNQGIGTASAAGQQQTGGEPYIRVLSCLELNYDYGDGTRGIGFHVSFVFYPSQKQKEAYSNFNVIVLRDTGLGKPPIVDKNNLMNQGPFYWGDEKYSQNDGYLPLYGSFLTVVDKQSAISESVQLQFFGLQDNKWVNLGEVFFGYQYSNGSASYYGPNIVLSNR